MEQRTKTIDDNEPQYLKALQRECQPVAGKSRGPRLSPLRPMPGWRRIKRMEADGIIARRVAIVDPEAVGSAFDRLCRVRTNDHSGPNG